MFTIPKGSGITPEIIKEAIDTNEVKSLDFQRLQNYYKGRHDILVRTKEGSRLKNNRIVTNHARYITKINVGYLLGNPIEYQAKKGETIKVEPVTKEYEKQTISNIDSELGTMNSKYGIAGEYIYASGNDVHSKAIDPRNYVVVYDDTMEHEKMFVIIYSCSGAKETRKYANVMVIDATQIQHYDSTLNNITLTEFHSFGQIPFVAYKNNADQEGDYEQVISLIDAYNTLMSDRVNDKEQLVEALLVIYGFSLTEDQQKAIKEHGVLGVPDSDGKAEYIVKQMQEDALEVLRKAIQEDIHKISMTPNLSDQEFAGNDSGVAIKYKLIAFELNTSSKESYFEVGLIERFVIYNNYLQKLNGVPKIEGWQVDAVFKRKLPQNDFETSQTIANLKGVVSDKTLVSQLSFVDDAEAELKQAKADAMERAQQLTDAFGTDFPSGTQPTDNPKPGDKKPTPAPTNKK